MGLRVAERLVARMKDTGCTLRLISDSASESCLARINRTGALISELFRTVGVGSDWVQCAECGPKEHMTTGEPTGEQRRYLSVWTFIESNKRFVE